MITIPTQVSRARERDLNAAIVQAEISESFEKHIEIFDVFYGDDIEVSSETREEPVRGRRECVHSSPTSWSRFT